MGLESPGCFGPWVPVAEGVVRVAVSWQVILRGIGYWLLPSRGRSSVLAWTSSPCRYYRWNDPRGTSKGAPWAPPGVWVTHFCCSSRPAVSLVLGLPALVWRFLFSISRPRRWFRDFQGRERFGGEKVMTGPGRSWTIHRIRGRRGVS